MYEARAAAEIVGAQKLTEKRNWDEASVRGSRARAEVTTRTFRASVYQM
jgi:hypothetical protein